jgi:hypothetical protein
LVAVSLWLAGILYAVSFVLPVATLTLDAEEVVFGWQLFIVIPVLLVRVFSPEAQYVLGLGLPFFWFANPLLWLAMYGLYRRRRRLAFIASILASLAGGCSLLVPLSNPQGSIQPLAGCLFWLASIAIVTATAVYRKVRPHKPRPWTEACLNSSADSVALHPVALRSAILGQSPETHPANMK